MTDFSVEQYDPTVLYHKEMQSNLKKQEAKEIIPVYESVPFGATIFTAIGFIALLM